MRTTIRGKGLTVSDKDSAYIERKMQRLERMLCPLHFEPQFWGGISEDCKDLLRRLLAPMPPHLVLAAQAHSVAVLCREAARGRARA